LPAICAAPETQTHPLTWSKPNFVCRYGRWHRWIGERELEIGGGLEFSKNNKLIEIELLSFMPASKIVGPGELGSG
jgi:hypothetical protein